MNKIINILKEKKSIPLDQFINISLYDKKFGYYMKKNPFGKEGDFITSPLISNLFGEMLAIWCIAFWEHIGKPRKILLVELGPGDGTLCKDLLKTFKQFKNFLKIYCTSNDPFFYAIYSKRYDQYCGMTSYLRITPKHGSIEVGHINYSPILQNTTEGTETMYLMMKNAFEVLGNRRYEWKCNNLNTASKNAAKRLGFKFEGVFRQMFVIKDRNRDSAWFAIIDKEWKKSKNGYLRYLKPSNFDKNYKQLKKLKI